MIPINVELPELHPTALRMNPLYVKGDKFGSSNVTRFLVYYEWAYTLMMYVIPFSVLIVVNSMVMLAIHRSRQVHAKLNVYDDGARKQELAKEISTSIMLVAIVLAFLLCNTLVCYGVLKKSI
jgi:hypothetical protein